MKMINDVDMYYECVNSRNAMPQWMAAERMDYCDDAASFKKEGLLDFLARLFA